MLPRCECIHVQNPKSESGLCTVSWMCLCVVEVTIVVPQERRAKLHLNPGCALAFSRDATAKISCFLLSTNPCLFSKCNSNGNGAGHLQLVHICTS